MAMGRHPGSVRNRHRGMECQMGDLFTARYLHGLRACPHIDERSQTSYHVAPIPAAV